MSIVPYRAPLARPRRLQLDQRQVVRAALGVLDDAGLDELTMRRIAERLGVKAASLYRHVRDKDELLVLLGDEICGEIPIAPASGSWRDQLILTARNVRRGLLAHRDAARLLAVTAPLGPHRLRQIEALLRILRSAGLARRDAARAAHHFNNFVTEFVADEGRFGDASVPPSKRRKVLIDARNYFKSLPKHEYPTLVDLADALTEDDSDGLFQFGLDVWLRGLSRLSNLTR